MNVLLSFTYHQAGHTDTTESWINVIPHADAPATDPLANRQLQEEKRDANKDKEDEVWDKVGTYRTDKDAYKQRAMFLKSFNQRSKGKHHSS